MTETLKLQLSGLSCGSCVGRAEKALAGVAGVSQVNVNLASATATLQFVKGATTPDALAAVVTEAGYPAVVQANASENRWDIREDIADVRGRFLIAFILTLPVFVIEMGSHFIPGVHHWVMQNIGIQQSWLLQFALVSLVLAWPGRRFFTGGIQSLRRAAPDMNALVAIGTGAAWLFSTVATFIPTLLPSGTAAVYFEAAAVIVTLVLLGRWLEARAKGRTGEAIRKLINLQPKTALVMRDGQVIETEITDIPVGAAVRVQPGARVPLDGVVIDGTSFVDESMITGEPVPIEKSIGAAVTGGTVNTTGAFTFEVHKTGADTMLAQIIAMVEDAQAAKLPIQDVINKITMYFVPAVLVLAALTFFTWLMFGPDPALGFALVAGVSVLIVACPCAMGLATPMSIMVGTGRAAEMGVLFRKGDALQALQSTQVVAFDKTGTLTAGRPELTTFVVTDNHAEADVLKVIASVEALSEHPIAQAIARAGANRELPVLPVTEFQSATGFGVQASVDGQDVLIGADRLMDRENISTDAFATEANTIAREGQTPLYAAINGELVALIGVSDPIKPATPEAIAALHRIGKKVAMITGDNQATAEAIAAKLGIDHVVAEVLPEGKVAALEDLRSAGQTVAFVGDGINDAPALAAADVGIAIGTGTDVAIESADVVLMSGDIGGVVNAFEISQRTMRNIAQNLFWAFGYNVAAMPVAAGVLYVFGGPLLSPMLAAGAMALSSVCVVSNALRLRWVGKAKVTA